MMTATCIAYREDGRLCGQPATILDQQRGGMVCAQHAPRQEWVLVALGGTLLRLDYDPKNRLWHRRRGLRVTLSTGPDAEPQTVTHHLELIRLEDFKARGYKTDSDGEPRTFDTPIGPCVLVLTPYQQ